MIRINLILSALLVFASSFLVTIRQADAGCDNQCRTRWAFIQLGPNGSCWWYEKSCCWYCTRATSMCINGPVPEGTTCVDSGNPDQYKDIMGCASACLVLPGTTVSEATGMPMGGLKPTMNYYWCNSP